jgi:hypothetical protein
MKNVLHLSTESTRVRKTVTIVMIVLALVASACAEGESTANGDAASNAVAEKSTTTSSEPATTLAPSTTIATTTTVVPSTTVVTSDDVNEAQALLASIKSDADMTSARIEGTFEVTGLDEQEAGLSELTMVFSSAFNAATGDSSMLMDTSSMAAALESDPDDPFAEFGTAMLGEMEFRQVGDRGYVRAAFFSMMLGNETPWISMPADDGAEFATDLESAPTDPHEVLGSYEGAAATVDNLGEESVNGTTATHYRISVDATGLMEELSPDERAELEESGLPAVGILPIDLWITDDGYLVRMILEVDGSEAESPDGEFQTMKLTFDMYEINGPVVIEAPPASEVTAVEDLDFGGFEFDFAADEL